MLIDFEVLKFLLYFWCFSLRLNEQVLVVGGSYLNIRNKLSYQHIVNLGTQSITWKSRMVEHKVTLEPQLRSKECWDSAHLSQFPFLLSLWPSPWDAATHIQE